MSKESIFIHIPKTGGTTINTAMNNTYWQTGLDFHYRHIDKDQRSNSADIFDPANRQKYADYTIFTMLREPMDRLISEYHFLKERSEYQQLLRHKPKDFEDYVKNKQCQNYVIDFLLGRRIYDPMPVTERDYEKVDSAFEELPIHCGIFEHYPESLAYFQKVADIDWPKKMEVKRMTFNRPAKEAYPAYMEDLVREHNQFDCRLYDKYLAVFKDKMNSLPKSPVSFVKDKYNHVIPYVQRTCLFEFCMNDKDWLQGNKLYFRDLTFYLFKTLQIQDGKKFTETWNETFLNTLRKLHPDSAFTNAIETAASKSSEPLERTTAIGEAIDAFFEEQGKKNTKEFRASLTFSPELVKAQTSGGFLKRLFGSK